MLQKKYQPVLSRTWAFAGFALIVSFNACKEPPSDSDESSVDNLVAGGSVEFALNECTSEKNELEKGIFLFQRKEDDPNSAESKETKKQVVKEIVDKRVEFLGKTKGKSKELKKVMEDVLTAAPMDILATFRMKHKAHINKIYLHDVPPPACNSKEESKGNTKNEFVPFSCYGMVGADGKKQPGVHIGTGKIAKSDGTQKDVTLEQAVRHGLLKAMVFYFTFVLKEYAQHTDTPGPQGEPILALGTQLEAALKKDLTDEQAAGKLGVTWENIKSTPDLKWTIMSHVMDSAFCSPESRQIFAACYPNTFQVFRTDGGAKADIDLTDEMVSACISSRQTLVKKTWGS